MAGCVIYPDSAFYTTTLIENCSLEKQAELFPCLTYLGVHTKRGLVKMMCMLAKPLAKERLLGFVQLGPEESVRLNTWALTNELRCIINSYQAERRSTWTGGQKVLERLFMGIRKALGLVRPPPTSVDEIRARFPACMLLYRAALSGHIKEGKHRNILLRGLTYLPAPTMKPQPPPEVLRVPDTAAMARLRELLEGDRKRCCRRDDEPKIESTPAPEPEVTPAPASTPEPEPEATPAPAPASTLDMFRHAEAFRQPLEHCMFEDARAFRQPFEHCMFEVARAFRQPLACWDEPEPEATPAPEPEPEPESAATQRTSDDVLREMIRNCDYIIRAQTRLKEEYLACLRRESQAL